MGKLGWLIWLSKQLAIAFKKGQAFIGEHDDGIEYLLNHWGPNLLAPDRFGRHLPLFLRRSYLIAFIVAIFFSVPQ